MSVVDHKVKKNRKHLHRFVFILVGLFHVRLGVLIRLEFVFLYAFMSVQYLLKFIMYTLTNQWTSKVLHTTDL